MQILIELGEQVCGSPRKKVGLRETFEFKLCKKVDKALLEFFK
jgi:hypothetical protein